MYIKHAHVSSVYVSAYVAFQVKGYKHECKAPEVHSYEENSAIISMKRCSRVKCVTFIGFCISLALAHCCCVAGPGPTQTQGGAPAPTGAPASELVQPSTRPSDDAFEINESNDSTTVSDRGVSKMSLAGTSPASSLQASTATSGSGAPASGLTDPAPDSGGRTRINEKGNVTQARSASSIVQSQSTAHAASLANASVDAGKAAPAVLSAANGTGTELGRSHSTPASAGFWNAWASQADKLGQVLDNQTHSISPNTTSSNVTDIGGGFMDRLLDLLSDEGDSQHPNSTANKSAVDVPVPAEYNQTSNNQTRPVGGQGSEAVGLENAHPDARARGDASPSNRGHAALNELLRLYSYEASGASTVVQSVPADGPPDALLRTAQDTSATSSVEGEDSSSGRTTSTSGPAQEVLVNRRVESGPPDGEPPAPALWRWLLQVFNALDAGELGLLCVGSATSNAAIDPHIYAKYSFKIDMQD